MVLFRIFPFPNVSVRFMILLSSILSRLISFEDFIKLCFLLMTSFSDILTSIELLKEELLSFYKLKKGVDASCSEKTILSLTVPLSSRLLLWLLRMLCKLFSSSSISSCSSDRGSILFIALEQLAWFSFYRYTPTIISLLSVSTINIRSS